MGNSLPCGTTNTSAVTDSSGWNCSLAATSTELGSCNFNATYTLNNGTTLQLSTCLRYEDVQPPGYAVMLASSEDLDSFWCSTAEHLEQTNISGLLEVADCECTEDDSDSDSAASNWLLGVMFSILSSFCTTFGTILQKYAHIVNDRKEKKARELGGILLSPWWLFALFIMVLLPLPFDFIAFSLAPQSLLVPFAGMTILLNAIFAPILLKEKITMIEIIATTVILVGLVTTTASGPKTDADLDACALLARYNDLDFLLAVIVPLVICAISLYFIHFIESSPLINQMKPLLYAICAGAFGGVGNIFFKATGEMAQASISGSDGVISPWTTIHPYYHIIFTIMLAVLQISHINQGLRRYDAVLYLPMYNTAYILISGSVGAIVYKEFSGYSTLQFVLFPLGVFITLMGIILMTRKQTNAEVAPLPLEEAPKVTTLQVKPFVTGERNEA